MPETPADQTRAITKGDDILDKQFRQSYVKQLVGQFQTVGDEVKDDEARKLGQKIAALSSEDVEWDDIYQLELVVVRLEPELRCRRRAGMLRAEFKGVAPQQYQEYALTKPPDAEKDPLPAVRADSVRIQEELNWYYTALWVQEAFRTSLLKRVARKTALYLACYLALGLLLLLLWVFGGLLNLFGNEKVSLDELALAKPALTNAVPLRTNTVPLTGMAATLTNESVVTAGHTSTNASVRWSQLTATERARWKTEQALPVLATYWLVIIAGTVGALVSILRRIQEVGRGHV